MVPIKVAIFLGSTRPADGIGPLVPGRLADRVCKYIIKGLPQNEFEVRVVDPAEDDYKLPMLEIPWHFAKAGKKPITANLTRLMETAKWAEAFVFVSPEYNHSVGPALTNLICHLPPIHYGGPFGLKPALLVTYSMSKFGGARAGVQLRSLAGEAGAFVCPRAINISEAHVMLDKEGNEIADERGNKPITDNFVKAKGDLLFIAKAFQSQRQQKTSSAKI